MTQQGWECPRCGVVYAPFTPKCWTCPPTVTTGGTNADAPLPEQPTREPSDAAPPEAREERSGEERRVRHIGGNRFMRDGDENQVWPGSRATFDRRTQPNQGRAARREP